MIGSWAHCPRACFAWVLGSLFMLPFSPSIVATAYSKWAISLHIKALWSDLRSVTVALELFLRFELLLSTRFMAFSFFLPKIAYTRYISVQSLACSCTSGGSLPGLLQFCFRLSFWRTLVHKCHQEPLNTDRHHRTSTIRQSQLHLLFNIGLILLVISAQRYLFSWSASFSSRPLIVLFLGFLILCFAHFGVSGAVHRRKRLFEKCSLQKWENQNSNLELCRDNESFW